MFFLKAYNNNQVLSVHALLAFSFFVSKFMAKSNSEFYLAPLKLLTTFENLLVTRLKDPKATILTLNMLTGSRL
jgi:hypothetical protein